MTKEWKTINLKVEHSAQRISIFRGETAEPMMVQNAQTDKRPYIHPIIAPDGKGCLTEDAPQHHPWQHGLYVGLNDVNGIGFWSEGLSDNPADGSFHPKPLLQPEVSGQTVKWFVETQWRDPQGRPMLTEVQHWTFTDLGTTYKLDLEWSLRAEIDLVFGEYAYGGLFLRMPFKYETGGEALNSERQLNERADTQRARWVAVSMPIEGRTDWAGMAIMDHPDNPEFPVPWRVDGQMGIGPGRCIVGKRSLAAGKAERYVHRVFVYSGKHAAEPIEAAWNDFTNCEFKQPK